MPHVLDGSSVVTGDTVFDVALGSGQVIALNNDGSVTVRFANGAVAGYTEGRTRRFPRRTLFWQDPVIGPPPKGEVRWAMLRAMADAAAGVLANTGGADVG